MDIEIQMRLKKYKTMYYKELNGKNLIGIKNLVDIYDIYKIDDFEFINIYDKDFINNIHNKNFSYCIFSNCTFSNLKFLNCNFKGVIFCNCNFQNIEFIGCDFYNESISIVDDECLLNDVSFINSNLRNSMFLKSRSEFINIIKSDFTNSIFKSLVINQMKIKDSDLSSIKILKSEINELKFEDKNLTILNTESDFSGIVLNSMYKKSYHNVSNIYKIISDKFKENNLYECASDYNYLSKYNKNKSLSGIKRFNYTISWILCGYGEKPIYSLITSIEIIIIFGIIYMFTGINVDTQIIDYSNFIKEGIYSDTLIMDFTKSLYFSVTTFTTVGYGDITPIGFSIFLSAIEMFLGLSMMGIWTASLAKKLTK